jgi:hypothetical protein
VVQAVSSVAPLADESRQLKLLIDNVSDHAIYLLDTQGSICSWHPAAGAGARPGPWPLRR